MGFSPVVAGPTVIKRLSGYECVGIDIPGGNDPRSFIQLPSIYAGPSEKAIKIGSAGATMIAPFPLRQLRGFTAVVLMDQKQGWIQSSFVTGWHNQMLPATRCYPALMSSGLWAFDYDSGPRQD